MQMLLSRSLWDAFQYNADDLVQDFVGLSGVVTRDVLVELEKKYKAISSEDCVKQPPVKVHDIQTAASKFLGRLWGGAMKTKMARRTATRRPPDKSGRGTSSDDRRRQATGGGIGHGKGGGNCKNPNPNLALIPCYE